MATPPSPPPSGAPAPGRAERYRSELLLFLLALSFAKIVLWDWIFIPIHSGERGVYWSRFFGGTSDVSIGEGTFVKLPWDTITIYDVRELGLRRTTMLLTRDGLALDVTWYVRFRPVFERLPELHRTLGPDYAERLIVPEIIASLRQIIGDFRAEEIYAQDESGLLARINSDVYKRLADAPVELDSVRIIELKLPAGMEEAIVRKLVYEQTFRSYEFRLQMEAAESKRKEMEANGLARFRELSGVDPVKWRGIEATVELAKSPNSKILFLGTDASQLPILLNTEPVSAAPTVPAPDPSSDPSIDVPSFPWSGVPPLVPDAAVAPAAPEDAPHDAAPSAPP